MKTRKPCTMKLGDNVAYSASFLRSTGQFTGALPLARGTATALDKFGGQGRALVTVKWHNDYCGEVPTKILDCNLAKVGTRAMNAD